MLLLKGPMHYTIEMLVIGIFVALCARSYISRSMGVSSGANFSWVRSLLNREEDRHSRMPILFSTCTYCDFLKNCEVRKLHKLHFLLPCWS